MQRFMLDRRLRPVSLSAVVPVVAAKRAGIPAVWRTGLAFIAVCLVAATPLFAQVLVIDTKGGGGTATTVGTVDRRFAQITPTHIELPKTALDGKTRLELIRFLQADQGFAMRPFPRGHRGLTLAANGLLEPAGESYLAMITSNGTAAKPGERLVITDIKFDRSSITFLLNGGPDAKHRFLSHVQIGTGPVMAPVVQGDEQAPTGSKLTLTFQEHVPELTGKQVEALLAPLISFEVKTPVQAFTDTLPPQLKQAILDHRVMVGMTTDMVLYAKGQPQSKIREMDGQMPFEEWIYGKAPEEVDFVRINGNRVIRLEVAKVGKEPVVFTKDEVEGLMRTDGTPLVAASSTPTRTVKMGDVERDPDHQAPAPPPSLRNPGEALPQDTSKDDVGTMRPVRFPKQAPDDHPVAHHPGAGDAQGSPPANGSQPATAGQPAANQPPSGPATAGLSPEEKQAEGSGTAPNAGAPASSAAPAAPPADGAKQAPGSSQKP